MDVSENFAPTLCVNGAVAPYVFEPKAFDVRLTSENTRNARANIYETDTARTIDTGGNNPDRNQGGLAIVYESIEKSYTSTLEIQSSKDKRNMRVRRLTPLECGRLQGFPDEWCEELGIENPNQKDIQFWKKVFETYRIINGKVKSKTDNQIIKWLNDPYSDSATYKMWGNGIALPCAIFIFERLQHFTNNT